MATASRRSLRLIRLNGKEQTDIYEPNFQLPVDPLNAKGQRLTPWIRSVCTLEMAEMMLTADTHGRDILYEDTNESDVSESYTSSETGSTSTHEGSESTTNILELDSVKSIETHICSLSHDAGDAQEKVSDTDHHDFKMSVSYESNIGWTTASGSSTKIDDLPKKRMQRRRSTVGWKDAEIDARCFNAPLMSTRSGRIVRPVSRSESLPSLKKRRTISDQHLKRRATTPPITSPASKSEPERPQSAMKHKSANRYSQGKEEEMIIVTSRDCMPQTEYSPDRSPFLSVVPLPSRQKVLRVVPVRDNDPDAFSPAPNPSRYRLPQFVLRSRASLPKTDFYERHKREEGSPTPEMRRYV